MLVQSVMPSALSAAAEAAGDLRVADCSRLVELLSLVPDPRDPRGIRHAAASVLAVAAAAVLAGCKSVLAIAGWAAEAPQDLLAALGARRSWPGARHRAPHLATFRRVLRAADADAVDAVIGSFLAEIAGFGSLTRTDDDPGPVVPPGGGAAGSSHEPEQQQQEEVPRLAGAVSVDGKTARGARQADGRAVHLLSAPIQAAGWWSPSGTSRTRPMRSPRSGSCWSRWTCAAGR
jgi:DDE_Tnp_1-associated